MRILFCCEFYAPSIGGVQEVMKQIAEHLILRGHDVTVATRKLPYRSFNKLNGVKIVEFEVSGNLAYGITGKIDAYQQFVISHRADVIMIKAAQQWTFDALWPILDKIVSPKVFIPCGFSGLYDPAFEDYFRKLPEILRHFDHLIFYSTDYRDINFTKKHGINNFSIIPNGASEVEFSALPDPLFRKRYGIEEDELLFLTVGSFTGAKGHFEVVKAFEKMKLKGRRATLILNGNAPCHILETDEEKLTNSNIETTTSNNLSNLNKKGTVLIYFLKKYTDKSLKAIREGTFIIKSIRFFQSIFIKISRAFGFMKVRTYFSIAEDINKFCHNKKVLITDLPRAELVQAFMASDLFVFASNIEYSPLVLFESAAAGTPFLSVPVGNAEEIARWTGAGLICPATRDKFGNTKVNPSVLAKYMAKLIQNKDQLNEMGANGKNNWTERFTWEKITTEYENIFNSLIRKKGDF